MKFSDGFNELEDSIRIYAAGADDDAADDFEISINDDEDEDKPHGR